MSWMNREKWKDALGDAFKRIAETKESDEVISLSDLLQALSQVRHAEMGEEIDTLREQGKNIKESGKHLLKSLRALLQETETMWRTAKQK